MNLLLDTNVVSEWVKPEPAANVVSWLASADEDRAHLSVVCLAELRRGMELLPQGHRRTRLAIWLAEDLQARFSGRIIDIDREIADAWGTLMARSRRAGIALGVMDGFVAATASVRGMSLVTRNVRDFTGLGIRLIDPWGT